MQENLGEGERETVQEASEKCFGRLISVWAQAMLNTYIYSVRIHTALSVLLILLRSSTKRKPQKIKCQYGSAHV